jgi:peptidoglycan-associated lipoprotein
MALTGCAHMSSLSGCGCGGATLGVPPGSEQDLVANVGDRVFFAFDQSALSVDARATLGRQAAWLAKYPAVDVLIAGNADERGTQTYDLALGERRAHVARDYLVASGVSAARIKTTSYGKDCPVAEGNNYVAYQQNRNAITSVVGYNPQNCR